MIWYKGDMLKQTGSTERDIKGRNIPLTPPPQLYSNVGRKLCLKWIIWYLIYIVGFHTIMLPVVSWSERPHMKMEANYWMEQGVYCTYVMFDKSRTWFFSVRDCWHDYVRQYQSYTFTLYKGLKMSIITYVASSQRSRTRLFCYVKCHIRFWPSWTDLHKSNNYRSGIIKMYLSFACLSLNWYVCFVRPTFDVQGVLEQKINIRFFGNVRDLLTPTTYHLHISHMAARFDFDSNCWHWQAITYYMWCHLEHILVIGYIPSYFVNIVSNLNEIHSRLQER